MVSEFKKRAWRRMVAGLFLLPALAEGGAALYAQQSVAAPAAPASAAADVKSQCKAYVAEGRKCLQANDFAKAKQYAQYAQRMGVAKWEYYEDSPDKLLGDIAALSGTAVQPITAVAPTTPAAPAATPLVSADMPALPPVGAAAPAKPLTAPAASKPTPPAAKPTSFPTDAHKLMKMGRDALKAGNLEMARECGKRAEATTTRWGLFDDSPRRLLDDVQKAKAEKDKVESEKLLVEARKAYQKGDLDKASEMAHKSEKLHGGVGSYSMWDLGDRPSKLLAEIESTKLRQRNKQVLPTGAKPDAVAAKTKTEPKPDTSVAARPTTHAKPTAQAKPTDPGVIVPLTAAAPAMTPARQKAVALMVECRTLEKADRLVEARTKAIEAQRLNADYAQGEDRPETALMQLNQKGVARINLIVTEAMKAAGPKPTTTTAATAQGMLAQARQFAQGMGLDTYAIDEKANWLAQVGGGKMAATPIAAANPAATQGRDMLVRAQLELRNGQVDSARRLAEAVYRGQFGMQTEALALIRNIEVEEQNQKVAAANRAYDAGMSAYAQGDYTIAMNVFLQIDQTLLTADKQARIKAKMVERDRMVAAVKPKPAAPLPYVSADPPTLPGAIKPVDYPNGPPPMPKPGAGTAHAGDLKSPLNPANATAQTLPPMGPGGNTNPGGLATQVQALQEVEFQRLRAEGLKVQREAQSRFSKGETDAAIQLLNEHLAALKQANLDPTKTAMLQRPVEYRLQTFRVLKTQRDAEVSLTMHQTQVRNDHARKEVEKDAKRKQVSDLMKQFNQLYDEGKFEDAEVLAMKAHELDPESDAPVYAQNIAKIAKRQKTYERIKNDKEEYVLGSLNGAEKEGPYVGDTAEPLKYDPDISKRAQSRKPVDGVLNTKMRTEKEKEIERKMSTPVTVEFNNLPLRTAMTSLGAMHKLNIVPDLGALKEKNVNPDAPVSLKADAISLKSALNIILDQVGLTWNIQNEVLMYTTHQAAKGKRVQKVYSVADLVIPIDNYALPNSAKLDKVLEMQMQRSMRSPFAGAGIPTQPPGGLTNGTTVGSMSTVPGGLNGTSSMSTTAGPIAASTTVTTAKNTIEDVLMKLITNTVQPGTWSDVGGSGTIDYFPIGMALVINQTPDIQEQVAELLDALRRLQDMEVSVEVRMITVAETFFERIGMDFAMSLPGQNTTTFENQITTGVFAPTGQLNTPRPRGVIAGVTPAGTLTSDLNIPIAATSFNRAIPPFAFPQQPGNNGGLSLGLAFLNDIQVFMFMEAAQGDRRTNVMQAPKLTLFNGQTSTIHVSDTQFFVTDVTVFSINGQIVFAPNNSPFPIGTTPDPTGTSGPGISLAIQAVVSADRRFVRMNIPISMSSLASATVPLFPTTVIVTPTFEGGFVGQPIPFTQFLQQPKFSSTTINTTVMVPDGGTVVLGGLKSLAEGRNEAGPPVLSKIPYINRLVKNTGYGREAQSMMIMVTPRIIINSEEEERQTGYVLPANQ